MRLKLSSAPLKHITFFEILVFLGESFLQPERKKKDIKKKKNVPTDRPYLEGLYARKIGFLLFVALSGF